MFFDYVFFIFYVIIVLIIVLILTIASDIISIKSYLNDTEKLSIYECGFSPIDLNFHNFDIKYYIVALLFLIFDVEIIFIVPYVNVFFYLTSFDFVNFMLFFSIFFLGLLHEWKNNNLQW